MKRINRVIFVAESGTCRAPMAATIFSEMPKSRPILCEARGLVVQFPEPVNPKVEAVLKSNGHEIKDYFSKQLTESDFMPDTLVVVMEVAHRIKVINNYEGANEENTQVLTEIVGDELEILNPYGAPLQAYGLCYETMRSAIERLVRMMD